MTTVESDLLPTEREQEQMAFVEAARSFAQQEILPNAAKWDREGIYPRDVMAKLGELGFWGLLVSEEYDGLGLDSQTYLKIIEELAAADAGVAITLAVHNSLPSHILETHGTKEQKETWLKPMARGEKLAAFCISEADSGSDVAAVSTKAVRDGNDWILNGTKAWVTSGEVADLFLIMVRTSDPEPTSRQGLSFFLVPAGTEGVEPQKAEEKMGLHSSVTNQVALTNVRLSDDFLIGQEGRGFAYAMEGLDNGRMGVAAQAIGIARAALGYATRYAAERKQFDKPIGDFQAIRFMLADMATRLEAARALLNDTALKKIRGENISTQASMAKLFASEMAVFVTNKAVQVFGGYGYTKEYPVERLFRDAKVTEIYEGTSEIQRVVIARGLFSELSKSAR
ncbi:MAG: acyl-CoA dehydrogenase family protein [Gemmatimonadota bacterium]|nr:acyl-CoA dehydrogenase family protein [Gemmatimonadota bacterium]